MARFLIGLFAIAAAIGLIVLIHVYLANRLMIEPGWAAGAQSTVMVAFVAGGVGIMVAAMMAERLGAPPWSWLVTWPGYLWMGTAWIMLAVVGASDLVLVVVGATGPTLPTTRALIALGVGSTLAALAVWGAMRTTPLTRVKVVLERWPAALDGLRVVQLTDLHIGPLRGRGWARRLVTRVNALDPDVVVLTGDLIDGFVSKVGPQTAPLGDLRAKHGVFAVLGNHEMFSGPGGWLGHLRDTLGIRVLANEHVVLSAPGEGDVAAPSAFVLAGAHDRSGQHFGHPEDFDSALVGRDPELPVVLLSHDPLSFPRAAAHDVDLMISGHTHGGQIWPFHLLVRAVIPFLAGLYRRGHSQLYVSRGTGFWGPPMRLGARPELTELTLTSPAL